MLKSKIKIKPSFVSKITTFLQIMTIIWVMISLPRPQIIWYTASLFTLISAFGYIIEGSKKLNE